MAYCCYHLEPSFSISYAVWESGIVPGKSEPNNLDPYIGVLVDEVNALNGTEFYDAYREETFKLMVDILMQVVDYPGHNKLFHCLGKLSF